MKDKISELERNSDYLKAVIKFQEFKYNKIVKLGIEREELIANLEESNEILTAQVITEQDLHASMIRVAEKNKE